MEQSKERTMTTDSDLREEFGRAIDMHLAHCDQPRMETCQSCRLGMESVDYALRHLAKAGYVVVPNGEHLLHQEEDSWAMEHTVECRQRGLMQCSLHELACSGAWRDTAPGVYRLVDKPGESVRLEVWP